MSAPRLTTLPNKLYQVRCLILVKGITPYEAIIDLKSRELWTRSEVGWYVTPLDKYQDWRASFPAELARLVDMLVRELNGIE